eukprot:4334770-Pyramimonas_sp.AAC.1
MALAPLSALAGLSVLRVRSGRPYGILPSGARRQCVLLSVDLSMRLSHVSLAGSPAGIVSAGAPTASADSATRGIGASAAGI